MIFRIIVLSFLLLPSTSNAIETYAEGYKMGVLPNIDEQRHFIFFWSGEGKLLMGKDSTEWKQTIKGEDGKEKVIVRNPWSFSTSADVYEKVSQNENKFIILKFWTPMVFPGLFRDTYNLVTDIHNVTGKAPRKDPCEHRPHWWQMHWEREWSKGDITGRIVSFEYVGWTPPTKSYEVVIQEGGFGNQFKHLSVLDPKMAKCAVDWMQSGLQVKIHFGKSLVWNPLARETDYDVVKISPIKDSGVSLPD